jgi:hypothetical protein
LNLEIVADITASDPTFSFSGIKDEIVLWGGYVNVLYLRESKASGLATAQQILADAKRLAKEALISGDLILRLDNPLPSTYRSLVSWGILVSMKGVLYSFKHEKLRDYLYASFAAEHEYMSKAIVLEIGPIRSRNILVWLEEIYRISDPQIHIKYLEAVLDG